MHDYTLIKALLISLILTAASLSPTAAADRTHLLALEDARHLLSRTGFGAAPDEVAHLIGKSRSEAVDYIAAGLTSTPVSPLPAWISGETPQHYRFGVMSSTDKQKFRQARLSEIQSLRQWWVQEMITTKNPQAERLLLFWHNHFATGYSNITHQSISIARQHLMLREHAAGNFRDLLKNIIRDPAMLNYLDNNNSKKQSPNENLARELMELFSLGEGNYTEADIKNAARALTGYSFSETYDMRYVFKPWMHDKREKTIFGETGKFNGDDLIELILKQPASARFITAKLWRELIGDIEETDNTLEMHAAAFRNSGYDIKTLYKSLLNSDQFWEQQNRNSIVKSPATLIIGTIRSTGILPTDWQAIPLRLQQMGQHLFDPPNVAGWPDGEAWITPGKLLTRLNWLEQIGTEDAMMQQSDASMSGMTMTSTDMASESMTMQSSSPMSMSSSQPPLTLRMASEDFDEPVEYRVRALGINNAAWDSGILQLHGGYDTKRMGRAEKANLPWQSVNFPVPFAAEEITAIEISFINDGTTPDGADRNLFVTRAVMGDRVWLSSDGVQTGKCPRKNQQGSLYCTGTLRLEKSSNLVKPTDIRTSKDTLRTSSVTLHFAQLPDRLPQAELVYVLSDVEFDGRFWNTLKVRYLHNKNGQTIRMSTTDCWPECVQEWPACSWVNEYSKNTISLELNQNEQHCMYSGLQPSDKKLIRALWSILDELYEVGTNSPKQQKEIMARNYKLWGKKVENLKGKIKSSHFNDNSINFEVIAKPIIDATLGDQIITPIPAGLTGEQRSEGFNALKQHQSELTVGNFLLNDNSIGDYDGSSVTLKEAITDLSYQLH